MNLTEELYQSFINLGKSKMGKANSKVSQGETAILNALKLYGPLTPSKLCELTSMSSAHTAKTICALKMKKDVTRLVDAKDKRSAVIYLTEQGNEKISNLHLIVKQRFEQLAEYLGEEDSKHLIRIINKISEKGEER